MEEETSVQDGLTPKQGHHGGGVWQRESGELERESGWEQNTPFQILLLQPGPLPISTQQ